VRPQDALAFVERHGIVLQAARGPVPSLAETIAGGPIRGSWWGHRKGREIFQATQAVTGSDSVLVCKLIDGKVTYVHSRLWPALVRLSGRFRKDQLARVWEEHTPSGAHRMHRKAFPGWVPDGIREEAETLSVTDAEELLRAILPYGTEKSNAAGRAGPRAPAPRVRRSERRR
jgi:hypothetical protein